jgi:hypothetical protein
MTRTHQRYSDELLADHLAVGKTVAAAAHAAGISERTAYRRMKQPAVRDRIAEVRRAALETASGKLHQGMVVACDTLTGLVGHADPNVQIRAAQTVIQLALKVRQAVDVADCLDPIAEPARPSPGGPVCPDTGSPPAGLDPGGEQTDRSDRSHLPDRPCPDSAVGPPTGTAPSDAVFELASGGDDRGGGVGLDRRPQPGRAVRMAALVGVLLLLTGLSFAFAGATRARRERELADGGGLPTCQTLTEPATAEVGPLSRLLAELDHLTAGSNSSSRVQAPTATATVVRIVRPLQLARPNRTGHDVGYPGKRLVGRAQGRHRVEDIPEGT